MCVIIYVKKGEEINQAELKAAWKRNPDGAGYAIRKDGKILFHRGFMTFEKYKKVINKLNKKFDLMIHVRITTSNEVNKLPFIPEIYSKANTIKHTPIQIIPILLPT
jgi:hypothetical protein